FQKSVLRCGWNGSSNTELRAVGEPVWRAGYGGQRRAVVFGLLRQEFLRQPPGRVTRSGEHYARPGGSPRPAGRFVVPQPPERLPRHFSQLALPVLQDRQCRVSVRAAFGLPITLWAFILLPFVLSTQNPGKGRRRFIFYPGAKRQN